MWTEGERSAFASVYRGQIVSPQTTSERGDELRVGVRVPMTPVYVSGRVPGTGRRNGSSSSEAALCKFTLIIGGCSLVYDNLLR